LEMGSHELFVWGWHWTVIIPISASQVARIPDLSHWHLTSTPSLKLSFQFLKNGFHYDVFICVYNVLLSLFFYFPLFIPLVSH
jgi:hypothetical protein